MDGERSFFMTVLVVFGDLSFLFKVSVIASEAQQSVTQIALLVSPTQ